jgi:hypothetical protein
VVVYRQATPQQLIMDVLQSALNSTKRLQLLQALELPVAELRSICRCCMLALCQARDRADEEGAAGGKHDKLAKQFCSASWRAHICRGVPFKAALRMQGHSIAYLTFAKLQLSS